MDIVETVVDKLKVAPWAQWTVVDHYIPTLENIEGTIRVNKEGRLFLVTEFTDGKFFSVRENEIKTKFSERRKIRVAFNSAFRLIALDRFQKQGAKPND